MFKILNNLAPSYLFNLCPQMRFESMTYTLRNENKLLPFYCKNTLYRRSFFPVGVNLWNELDVSLLNCITLNEFKSKLKLQMMKQKNNLFSIFDSRAAVNHTRIRLGLSGLNGQRYLYNFIPYAICPKCGNENESAEHYLLFCHSYAAQRETLFTSLDIIYETVVKPHRILISRQNITHCLKIILKGDENLDYQQNKDLFKAIQDYICDTKRFA